MLRSAFFSKTMYLLLVALLMAGCGNGSKPKSRSVVGSDAPVSTTSTTSNTDTTTGGASAKDIVPPDTSIASGPTGIVSNKVASFTFTGTDDVKVAGYACRLNSASWTSCVSPKTYSNLADGTYTFEVRAIDAAGNVDASPATSSWTVDTTPPNTSIVSGASGLVSSTSNSFAFTCDQGVCTYQCAVNTGSFAGCGTPYAFAGQTDATYTLQVRATDAAGNTDASPVGVSWTVDSTPPIVTISDGPASVTDVTTATNAHFVFACNEVCTTTWCSLDGVTATTCNSSMDVTGLTTNLHTFAVTAVDLAGNATISVTSQTWRVITVPESYWQPISGGTFVMGDALDGLSDAPVHSVTLSTFNMMSYEVTNGTYQDCVTAGSCTVPGDLTSYSYSRNPYYGNATYADYPVINVNWQQAVDYCSWAGGRLPTEAEWEYAARGGLSGQRFPWGDMIGCDNANYYSKIGYTYDMQGSTGFCATPGDTTQVGSYYAANGYSLYDMAGNVYDWVNDWYDLTYYSSSPVTDPQGPATGSYRVLRGGDFDGSADVVRVAHRSYSYPTSQGYIIGFRCVR